MQTIQGGRLNGLYQRFQLKKKISTHSKGFSPQPDPECFFLINYMQSLTSKLVGEGGKEVGGTLPFQYTHTHTHKDPQPRLVFIHSFSNYESGTVLGTEDTVINKNNKTPCLQGAYILVVGVESS